MEQILLWLCNQWEQRRQRARAPRDEMVLGVSAERDTRTPFVLFPEKLRVQHLGILGLSGTGKTYFIEHMIRQDIRRNTGFVVFDVHGDLADHVVSYLAERAPLHPDIWERTIVIEPFDPERSVGFNPLERTGRTSAFLQAHEFARILRARWERDARGSRTEEVLFNALFALAATGRTLLDLPRLLTRANFRGRVVTQLERGEVKEYWTERFDKLSPKMQSALGEPVLTRVRPLLENPILRDILGQAESTFSFRQAIERRLFVVINLSKGRLGEENSSMLGGLLFAKLALDIMSLADVPEEARTFFCVYADEVQNLASDTFGQLIAEARKYRVGLVAGHQFWRQLTPSFRQAVLAMGSKLCFRLHYQDALTLAAELSPQEQYRYVRHRIHPAHACRRDQRPSLRPRGSGGPLWRGLGYE
jgi:type IV secretion system coupling TraD/TrwB family protein